MIQVKNLAQFKKYLDNPKASLRMVSLEWFIDNEWKPLVVKFPEYRSVAKLQSNSFALKTPTESGLSWMQFGNAADWTFDPSTNTVTNYTKTAKIVYQWAYYGIPDGES